MNAIFACKLYKASTRKQKIQAALQNPINAELVQQLDECLGDEYKPVTEIDGNVYETIPNSDASTSSDTSGGSSAPTSHSTSSGGGLGGLSSALSGLDDEPSISEEFGDELDAEGEAAFDATQGDSTSTSGTDSDTTTDDIVVDDTTATAATKTNGKPIVAETVVTKPLVETQISLSGLAGELKGTLNARTSTAGVGRVSTKNDEVWIYYNDDINLNNVMTDVINTLTASNYHYLIFNRLARTDNAIVFTINGNDTANVMEPMSNE